MKVDGRLGGPGGVIFFSKSKRRTMVLASELGSAKQTPINHNEPVAVTSSCTIQTTPQDNATSLLTCTLHIASISPTIA